MIGHLTLLYAYPSRAARVNSENHYCGGSGDFPCALNDVILALLWQSKPFQPVVFGCLIELQSVLHRRPLIRLPRLYPERVSQT